MLKAPPQRFRPRLVTAAPPDKATELGNPVHRLDQRGGLLWWSRTLMDGTIQSLPFVEVQQDATGHVGHRPRQHCGIKNPPGNDTIQRQAALQALATCELACFNPTPAFQNPVPDFNAPATGIPLHALGGVVDRIDRDGAQQQPLDGRDVRWRLDFLDLYSPQRDHRQAFALAMAGRTQHQGTKPQRQRRVPGHLWPPTWYFQLEVGAHRLWGYSSPDIALGPLDTPVPRGPNQQIDPRRARSGQHVIDISFAVPDAHQPGRGTAVMGSVHGVETVEPCLTFFLADGELLAPRPFPHVGRVPGPNLLRQEPQRHALGRDR